MEGGSAGVETDEGAPTAEAGTAPDGPQAADAGVEAMAVQPAEAGAAPDGPQAADAGVEAMAVQPEAGAASAVLHEPPGAHWPANTPPSRRKINSGPSPATIVRDRDDLTEHVRVEQFSADEFVNSPVDLMLYKMARGHTANHTGNLDWNRDATPLGSRFKWPNGQSAVPFVDTIVVQAFIPDYHVTPHPDGNERFILQPEAAAFLRSVLLNGLREGGMHLVTTEDIQLINGLQELGKPRVHMQSKYAAYATEETPSTSNLDGKLEAARVRHGARNLNRIRSECHRLRSGEAVPDRLILSPSHVPANETDKTRYFTQRIKIASCAEDVDVVLATIVSGELASRGFYLVELDTSVDCAGSFRKADVVDDLKSRGYIMQREGCKADADAFAYSRSVDYSDGEVDVRERPGTILDNEKYVGKNCLSVITRSGPMGPDGIQLPMRQKAYLKLVSNLEQRMLRQGDVGWNGLNNAALMFNRVSRSIVLPLVQKHGFTRAENTLFTHGVEPDKAHLYAPATRDAVVAALMKTRGFVRTRNALSLSLEWLWLLYCEKLSHILVVVDSRYDRACIIYAMNEVTDKITGLSINHWSAHYRYVLERCAFALIPMDIVTVHRGRDVPDGKVRQPLKKRKSRKLTAQQKAERMSDRKRQKLNTRDIRSFLNTDTAPVSTGGGAGSRGDATINTITADSGDGGDDDDDGVDDDDDEDRVEGGDRDGDGESDDDEVESEVEAEEEDEDEVDTRSTVQTTAAPRDFERYNYAPGYMQPDDPAGAMVTSQRVIRAPKARSDLEEDGSYNPETRLCQDSLGTCFKPDGARSRELYGGGEDEEPFPLPQGFNPDSTHIDDVGDRTATRHADIDVARQRQQDGGMTPNEYCNLKTFPPGEPKRRNQNYAHIISAPSQLPIQRRVFLNRAVLGELPVETRDQRVERLLDSFNTYPDERDAMLAEQTHFMDSHAYKTDVLGPARGRLSPLASIQVGVQLDLVAVELRGANTPHSLAFYTPDGDATKAYASRKEFNAVFHLHRTALAPLLNEKGADGKMPCYMSAQADGAPIGFIGRVAGPSPTQVVLNITINLPDGTALQLVDGGTPLAANEQPDGGGEGVDGGGGDEGANGGGGGDGDANGDGGDGDDAVVPVESVPLPVLQPDFRQSRSLAVVLQERTTWQQHAYAMFRVHRVSAATEYNNSVYVAMGISFNDGDIINVKTHGTIVNMIDDLATHRDMILVNKLSGNREISAHICSQSDAWWFPVQHCKSAYSALREVKRQMQTALPSTRVVAIKFVPNARRDKQVPIFKTADGLVYRFTAPQSVLHWAFQEGDTSLELNTDAWTVTPA